MECVGMSQKIWQNCGSSKSKNKFLIQHTNQFSDMFTGIKKAVFVIKPITIDGKIGPRAATVETIEKVKEYLKLN